MSRTKGRWGTSPAAMGSSETLEIPAYAISAIIGTSGTRIHELQTKSGAKIKIDCNAQPAMAYMFGSPTEITKAKDLILEVVNDSTKFKSPSRPSRPKSVEPDSLPVGHVMLEITIPS